MRDFRHATDNDPIIIALCDGDFANTDAGRELRESFTIADVMLYFAVNCDAEEKYKTAAIAVVGCLEVEGVA